MKNPLYKTVAGNLIVKKNTQTSGDFGTYPEARTIENHLKFGVINLDKPCGPTSHETVAWVRDMLGVSAGHSGTLDPKVSGVLPVALGSAKKALSLLFEAGKEYICIMRLHGDFESEKVIKTISKFQGEIYQRPPVKSAVKRELRIRKIYYIHIEEISGRKVLMRIGCEAGTYIRKLCHDIGFLLGCGAHMEELRRTKAGPFEEENTVTLQDVKDAHAFWKENGIDRYIRNVVRPVETVLEHIPKIIVRDTAVDALCHGADLAIPGVSKVHPGIKKGSAVVIFTLKNELVAIAEAKATSEQMLSLDSGIVAKTKRVIMDLGTYPSTWKRHNLTPAGVA